MYLCVSACAGVGVGGGTTRKINVNDGVLKGMVGAVHETRKRGSRWLPEQEQICRRHGSCKALIMCQENFQSSTLKGLG